MSAINQKEYLKKYLSIGKDPTKKKKRKKVKNESRLKVIDDDHVIFESAVKEDLEGESEDAPQIVAVIDDRPPSLRVDEKSNAHLWIPIGSSNQNVSDSSSSPSKNWNINLTSKKQDKIKKENNSKNSNSPSRKSNKDRDDRYVTHEEDASTSRSDKSSLSTITSSTMDISHSEIISVKEEDITPERNSESSYIQDSFNKNPDSRSPLRSHVKGEYDMSPPRRKKVDDISPPRKKKDNDGTSPPRRSKGNEDISPPRRNKKNEDISPPRKQSRNSERDEDMSPPRRHFNKGKVPSKKNHDISPPRKRYKNHEGVDRPEILTGEHKVVTPPRKHSVLREYDLDRRKKSRWSEGNVENAKILITLDGKTAGLQNAKDLVEETQEIKRKEDELFKNMSSEVSGANASTIIRDKKTGKVRNLEEETTRDLEKERRDHENKVKYSKWGRGLRQVEEATAKRADELNEMSKPLARYADDDDLERYLKEQEWEGDPMLAYIRKKKKKQDIEEGKPIKPTYMGEFMPNRFGIRPGHRWDGVDRSNGYEKRWFEVQNSKVAQQEESYKWSTEDM